MRKKTVSTSTSIDPATQYAQDVVKGKIVAGKFVRAACQRHLNDLETCKERNLYWDTKAVDHVIGYFKTVLTVTDGPLAGQPFDPIPWQAFILGSLFGWKHKSGLRRFRTAWIETGKGSGKSPTMAGIGLYMMTAQKKMRAQVYAIASDRNQASIALKDGVAMCKVDIPSEGMSLEARGSVILRGTGDNVWKIEHPKSSSFFRALANGETVSGPRPWCVIADEIHEFKSAYSLKMWKAAIDKVAGDPLLVMGTNTPGTDQIIGTEYSGLFQRVALGQVEDDSLFSFIARCDEEDDVMNDESVWVKANPSLGITFPIDNVRARVKTAKALLSEEIATKRLYFGIPTGSAGFWISERAWMSCLGRVDEDMLCGLPCYLGLDLSKKNDLTPLSAAWVDEPNGTIYVKTWYFTTQEGLLDRARTDNAPYYEWSQAGHLEALPGATVAYDFAARRVQMLYENHDVRAMAFDPAKIGDFIDACDDIGFPVWKFEGPDKPAGEGLMLISHGQGTRVVFVDKSLCMPRSIERFEDYILNGKIVIDENPVTTMCASNAVVIADAMNNRAFDKRRSLGRIDGMVSMAEAVGATALLDTEPSGKSVYEERGILFV